MKGPRTAEAFGLINEKVKVLLAELKAKNTEDRDATQWCSDKEKELTQRIDDTEMDHEAAEEEEEAASTSASTNKDHYDDAKKELSTIEEKYGKSLDKLEEEIKSNMNSTAMCKKDLEKVNQARVALGQVFAGENDVDAEEGIMSIVDGVVTEYQNTIREHQNIARMLIQKKEDTKVQYKTNKGVQKEKATRHLGKHQKETESAARFREEKRTLSKKLDGLEETEAGIFAGDGKCVDYQKVYEQRIKERDQELENLTNAASALQRYMAEHNVRT